MTRTGRRAAVRVAGLVRPRPLEQHVGVMTRRSRIGAAVLALAVAGGLSACSHPDPNPPVKLTGDPQAAMPSESTTTTSTTTTTTTTLFYAQNQPTQPEDQAGGPSVDEGTNASGVERSGHGRGSVEGETTGCTGGLAGAGGGTGVGNGTIDRTPGLLEFVRRRVLSGRGSR